MSVFICESSCDMEYTDNVSLALTPPSISVNVFAVFLTRASVCSSVGSPPRDGRPQVLARCVQAHLQRGKRHVDAAVGGGGRVALQHARDGEGVAALW